MEVCIHRIKVEIFFIYQTQDGEIAMNLRGFRLFQWASKRVPWIRGLLERRFNCHWFKDLLSVVSLFAKYD